MNERVSRDIEQQQARITLLREELRCAQELLRLTQQGAQTRVLSIRVSVDLYQEIANRAGADRKMSTLIREALERAFPCTDTNAESER